MAHQRILVTGATGLVGSALVGEMKSAGVDVRAAVRTGSCPGIESVAVGEIGPDTDWGQALKGCDTVVHLAGATPDGRAGGSDFQRVNVLGTRRLVDTSLAANVGRLVFLSSIFAVSDRSPTLPLDDMSAPAPATDYGRSKLAAEAEVKRFSDAGGIAVSLRPPLIYDARAKGNFALLLRLAWLGIPLPFGSIDNRRSLVGIDNLVGAILAIVHEERPASGAFCLDEGAPVGLAKIIASLRNGMQIPPRLVPVGTTMLRAFLMAAGRGPMVQSLLGDLEVDASRFRAEYRWSPKHSTLSGLERTGAEFRAIMQARVK